MLTAQERRNGRRRFSTAVIVLAMLLLVTLLVTLSHPTTALFSAELNLEGRLNYTIQQFADGMWYTAVHLADMDYDSNLEVLIGNRNLSSLEIWRYDASLDTLLKIDTIEFSYHIHDIKTADFDGDGDIDIVVGLRFNGLYYVTNTGTPGTVGSWSIRLVDRSYSWQVLVEDFDGDGNLDIFHGVDYGPIHTFYGDGAGNFIPGPSVEDPTTSMRFTRGFTAVDLNSDGRLDLIGVDGAFMRAFLNPFNRTDSWTSVGLATPIGDYPSFRPHELQSNLGPSAGDLDGNGFVDQVAFLGTPESVGPVEVLVFEGGGSVSELQWTKVVLDTMPNFGWAGHTGVADLDGDGNLDIHVGGWDRFDGLHVYLGDGRGGFMLETIPLDHGVGEFNTFAIGDVNKDGSMDIVTNRHTSYRGDSSGFEILFGKRYRPPIAIDDRYDVYKEQELFVSVPGVLANDIISSRDSRIYYVALDQNNQKQVFELAWYDDQWHYRNVTADAVRSGTTAPSPTSSAVTSISVNGEPRVYYVGIGAGGYHVYELAWHNNDMIWKWRDLTSELDAAEVNGQSPIISTTVNGDPRVYYLDAYRHVHEMAWFSGMWHYRNVTTDASGVPAARGSTLAVTTITNGDPRVYYLADDGHVHELAWRSLTHLWSHRDVTANADGPRAVAGSALTALAYNTEPRVYYLAEGIGGLHVHELAWMSYLDPSNAKWYDTDLTDATDGAVAMGGTDLSAITYNTEPRVYYMAQGPNGAHVHELAWMSYLDPINAQWYASDLTDKTEGPPAVVGSALSAMTNYTEPRVYYLTQDFHVHEMAWLSYFDPVNARWYDSDLTGKTGGPTAIVGSPLSSTVAGSGLLTARLVSNVAHGILRFDTDGTFSYTPAASYTGNDSFTYVANDGTADSNVATVSINVEPVYDLPIVLSEVPNYIPPASDTMFVRESGLTMDEYRYNTDGPIRFTIEIDRVVGRTDAQGYLLEPQKLIENGIVSPKVTLGIYVYDVDNNYTGVDVNPEVNKVYFNGHYIGTLVGADNAWTRQRFEIDVRYVKFAIPACFEYNGVNPPAYLSECADPPITVQNEIRIDIDTANSDPIWGVGVDAAALWFEAARPILLVHGRGGSGPGEHDCSIPNAGDGCEYWDKYDGFYYFGFRGLINRVGFLTAHTENFLSQNSITDNAIIIKKVIQKLKIRYGVDKINIVAHSKGGLDSRGYISNDTLNTDDDVASLVTLATPHNGSYLADIADTLSILLASTEYASTPAMKQLTEKFVVNTFNPYHPARAGVRYYSIFADSGTTCIRMKFFFWLGIFLPVYEPCADDDQVANLPESSQRKGAPFVYDILMNNGVFQGTNDFNVTVNSARLSLRVLGHNNENTMDFGPYELNHHSIASAARLLGVMDRSITNLISNLLSIKTSSVASSGLQFTVQEVAEITTNDEGSNIGIESDILAEGQTYYQLVGMDAVTKASFLLTWQTGDFYLNLIDPNGRVITPITIDDNINYMEDRIGGSLDDLFLTSKLAAYSIEEPVMGQWQVQITAADQLPGNQANWSLIVAQDSDITISVTPDAYWKPLGDTVYITAEVKTSGAPFTNAMVQGSVVFPDGIPQIIALYDDGMHGDGLVNDGVYGNSFVGSQFGAYSLTVNATGTSNGIPFSRTAISEVQVASGTASIFGTFDDRGIDKDEDGLYDVLQIMVPLKVMVAGEYMVFGELRSSRGILLATANTSGNFALGQQMLALDFNGEEIWTNDGNGRFKLSNLTLLDMNTSGLPVKIDYAEMAYTTKSYSREEFQRPDVFLTGVTEDYGVDFDGNGKFDELVVEVEANLRADGNYEWRGTLVGADGYEFGIHSSSDNLSSGLRKITFRFTGEAIGNHRRNGPYYLVNLELWGDGGFIKASEAGQTEAYNYRRFETTVSATNLYLPIVFR